MASMTLTLPAANASPPAIPILSSTHAAILALDLGTNTGWALRNVDGMVTAKSAESAKQQQPQEPQTLKLRSALFIFSLVISTLQEAQKRKSSNAPTHFAVSRNSSRFSQLQEAQKRKFFSLKGRRPPQKRGGTPIPGVLCWDDG